MNTLSLIRLGSPLAIQILTVPTPKFAEPSCKAIGCADVMRVRITGLCMPGYMSASREAARVPVVRGRRAPARPRCLAIAKAADIQSGRPEPFWIEMGPPVRHK